MLEKMIVSLLVKVSLMPEQLKENLVKFAISE